MNIEEGELSQLLIEENYFSLCSLDKKRESISSTRTKNPFLIIEEEEEKNILDLLLEEDLVSSRNEARRLIKQKALEFLRLAREFLISSPDMMLNRTLEFASELPKEFLDVYRNIEQFYFINKGEQTVGIVNFNLKTGRMVIHTSRTKGEIFFEKGEIVHARWKGYDGKKAFHKLMEVKNGRFAFINHLPKIKHTINEPLSLLLLSMPSQDRNISEPDAEDKVEAEELFTH